MTRAPRLQLPLAMTMALRRIGIRPTPSLLLVSVARQTMSLLGLVSDGQASLCRPTYQVLRRYLISTSRFGTGQILNSHRTPLGLHKIAAKAGAGYPVGTAFKNRRPVGCTWQGQPNAPIAHRILWLGGLESGFNHGGNVDSFRRTIYIHGVGNEPSLGRPASCGCIHLAAADLMPLYDRLPVGTLVWISEA